jgi:hypothetical protein
LVGESALAIGLLTHVLILAITSIGGVLAVARLGVSPAVAARDAISGDVVVRDVRAD